ncbi:MAG: TetR/AcrR family transcriptional regulator [Lachnospiraceae bacterium]|nr:TetR/AcrR family transcriptional regulator [Lachnospiraceae bacterium]MBQ6197151.1 TetR/AcrR family transcriptional regulator [Lachnospiraceae bacterium]
MKKNTNQTKSRIVNAAWQLFYKYGYENTTVDDIVEASQTSKGSFYHYFDSKDALLGSLSYLFDEKYEELEETMDPGMDPVRKLIFLNQELFLMIENTVSVSLLSQLFAAQLIGKGEKHLLNPDRTYYKLLRQIVIEGKEQGIFFEELTVNDITKSYALWERAVMYDWCILNGNYSICQYAKTMLPLFLKGMMK